MKEILVIDAPNNCSECPCCSGDECGNQYKGYVGIYLGWNSGRPSWCPLRPLPTKVKCGEKKSEAGRIYEAWCEGYNACLKELLGETE